LFFSYNSYDYINKNAELKQCIDQIEGGFFSPQRPDLFQDVANILKNHDRCDLLLQIIFHMYHLTTVSFRYFICADYEAYIKCQEKVNKAFSVSVNLRTTGPSCMDCIPFL